MLQYVTTGCGLEAYHLQQFRTPQRKNSFGMSLILSETQETDELSQDSCGHIQCEWQITYSRLIDLVGELIER